MIVALLGLACTPPAPQTFPVTGTVVEVRDDAVVIAHDDIDGFMDAMTMPFFVDDPAVLPQLSPGDTVRGTLVLEGGSRLVDLVVTSDSATAARTGTVGEPTERPPALKPGESVPVGALFPATPVRLAQGAPITLGVGQRGAVALTFVYTRCPIPEYCPLVVSRLAALQPLLPERARIVAVTLDPEHDSRSVLADYGRAHGAIPGRWDFGRVPAEVLVGLAEKAGLKSHGKGLGITHDLLLLVLNADGRVVVRYRDMDWALDSVVEALGGAAP